MVISVLCRVTSAFAVLAAALSLGACDDDPTQPPRVFPEATFANEDTIGRQEAIRVVFSDSISAATALDPANFIVINLCTGLRVAGSLRLAGDTLIFSPSQPLPFLTPISIRVQNLLTPSGISQPTPLVGSRVTEAPPVRDVSWEFLNSPTGFSITGLQFADRDVGYLLTNGGELYQTTNGGIIYAARFKDVNITSTNALQVISVDTLFFVGALLQGGTVRFPLFRSVDGGATIDTVASVSASLQGLDIEREASGALVGLFGGQSTSPQAFRYDPPSTVVAATGLPTSGVTFRGIALSRNTTTAVVAMSGQGANAGRGFASRSLDAGRTYTPITLPADARSLRGTGFINQTDAFLLGDSSTVLRVNVASATDAAVALGLANGIPQTEVDAADGSVTTYSFRRAEFTAGGQIGWIVGSFVRDFPNVADVSGGVILMTRDGGQTFTRQAIRTAAENGLRFPPILDLEVLAPDFAAVGGSSGLTAARKSDTQTTFQACTFPSN